MTDVDQQEAREALCAIGMDRVSLRTAMNNLDLILHAVPPAKLAEALEAAGWAVRPLNRYLDDRRDVKYEAFSPWRAVAPEEADHVPSE